MLKDILFKKKKIITSRKQKDNNVTIIIKATEENVEDMMLVEFRKTIRKLNRLSEKGVGFEIIVISED